MELNSKQYSTLKSVFNEPVLANIHWSDIEILFRALGAELSEGQGSRQSSVKWSICGISSTASAEGNRQGCC